MTKTLLLLLSLCSCFIFADSVRAALISQANYSLVYVDSAESGAEDGAGANAFDGDTNTIWVTEWSDPPDPAHPHEIQIDLGSTYDITEFRYLPREDGYNGDVSEYEFYVSDNTTTWGTAVATGTFPKTKTEKTVTFASKTGRYVRLVALSEVDGNPWTAIAELSVAGTEIIVATPVTSTTINTAIASAQPGDTVVIPDGTYTLGSELTGPIIIASTVDGTETNPITLRAETPGGVIITGDPNTNRVMTVYGDWWIIRDFWFKDIDNPATGGLTRGVFTSGTTGVRITNNKITNFNNTITGFSESGWMFWDGNPAASIGTRIDHNTFDTSGGKFIQVEAESRDTLVDHNYATGFGEAGSFENSGIQLGSGGSDELQNTNVIFEYNVFGNSDADALHFKTNGNTVRYNTFINCDAITERGGGGNQTIHGNYFDLTGGNTNYAMLIRGPNNVIYNNYINAATSGGQTYTILFGGTEASPNTGDYFYARDTAFYNNTIVNSNASWGAVQFGKVATEVVSPDNISLTNNIITHSSTSGSVIACRGATNLTFTSSLHYAPGSSGYWLDVTPSGCDEITSGITKAYPNLTNEVVGSYTYQVLQSSNDGTAHAYDEEDLFQGTREDPPDIGAIEYGASRVTPLVTTSDVGSNFSVQTDTTPPSLIGASPTGSLTAGTTSTTISVNTETGATCKYSTTAGTAYTSMTNTMSESAGTYSATVSGLTNGSSYNYYVRCTDGTNPNLSDTTISFSIDQHYTIGRGVTLRTGAFARNN